MTLKIGEARKEYRAVISQYRDKLTELDQRRQEIQKKIDVTPDGAKLYEEEAATLELSYEAVSKKQDEYRKYMDQLTEQWASLCNMKSAQQQGEAMKEYVQDLGKIMEVARRLMKGGIVPASDEKKLMDYSMEMYQAAKNIGSMIQRQKREKYDSLWDDEDDKKEFEDPFEFADGSEAFCDGPVIVDAGEVSGEMEA